MYIFLLILYVIVGALVCFAYKYLTYATRGFGRNKFTYCDGDQSVMAIFSGALWPFVAPFSFAIVLARYYVDKKESEASK